MCVCGGWIIQDVLGIVLHRTKELSRGNRIKEFGGETALEDRNGPSVSSPGIFKRETRKNQRSPCWLTALKLKEAKTEIQMVRKPDC